MQNKSSLILFGNITCVIAMLVSALPPLELRSEDIYRTLRPSMSDRFGA